MFILFAAPIEGVLSKGFQIDQFLWQTNEILGIVSVTENRQTFPINCLDKLYCIRDDCAVL